MPRSSSRGRSFGGGGGGYRSYSTSSSPGYRSNGGYRSGSSGYSGYRSTSRTPSSPSYNTISQQRGPGMGLGSMLATGMAFGAGSSIAHHAIGGMLGRPSGQTYPAETQSSGSTSQPVPYYEDASAISTQSQKEQELQNQIKSNPCYNHNMKFIDCLKEHDKDISQCQTLFNDLVSCEKSLV